MRYVSAEAVSFFSEDSATSCQFRRWSIHEMFLQKQILFISVMLWSGVVFGVCFGVFFCYFVFSKFSIFICLGAFSLNKL